MPTLPFTSMSLPLIAVTAAEVHRLAIAGSALAADDFRLKKIVPQLEALGAKAPIFTRIAQGVQSVIGETDAAKAGRALLDLSTLLTAIQYTQSPHGAEGEFTPINTGVLSWTPTVAGYRSLAAVVDALTTTGEGRLEIVRDAAERGLFKDLRLMQPAVGALSDRFGELADFVAEHAIPQFGPVVIPMLKTGFDPKGGNPHARRLRALCRVDAEEGRAFARAALEEARKEVKVAAIEGLRGSDADVELILGFTKDRSEDVRHSAIRALAGISDERARKALNSLFKGKDAVVALAAAAACAGDLPQDAFEAASELLAAASPEDDVGKKALAEIAALTEARLGRRDARTREWLDKCLATEAVMADIIAGRTVAEALFLLGEESWDRKLVVQREKLSGWALMWSFLAAHRRESPEQLLKGYGELFRRAPASDALPNLLAGRPPRPVEPIALSSLHRGWLKVALTKGYTSAVAWMAQEGDIDALQFLLNADAEETKRFPHYAHVYAAAIIRIDPGSAPEFLMSRIEAKQKAQGQYIYFAEPLFALLQKLPASNLEELEKRGAKWRDPWKARLDEALAVIRHNAATE